MSTQKQTPPSLAPDFSQHRHDALYLLWMHHSTVQSQWPAVVAGVVFVGLATITSTGAPTLLDLDAWGGSGKTKLMGVALVFAGLGTMAMMHTMSRARSIMKRIEQTIDELEAYSGVPAAQRFGAVNHPSGVSGPLLIRYFLVWLVALPSLCVGMLLFWGVRAWPVCIIVVTALIGESVFQLRHEKSRVR